MNLLQVKDLCIGYHHADGTIAPAVRGVSFSINRGESVGLVGESGSGKSTVARALLGYCRPGGSITSGSILIDGQDVRTMEGHMRGARIAFVPQNPLSSLTPHMKVGSQLDEAVRRHRNCSAKEARERTLHLLSATGLPNPTALYRRYPHQLSGGQRQRVVIAAALAGTPALIVLDEPTTALDRTTEVQILELIQRLRAEFNPGIVYVSHDLHVISQMCDRVLVMLDGVVVEEGAKERIFNAPRHEYTRTLLGTSSRLEKPQPIHSNPDNPLLSVRNLAFSYGSRPGWLRRLLRGNESAQAIKPTLQNISFEIGQGETLGLVGESGSGKSTAGNIVAGLQASAEGTLCFAGQPLPISTFKRSKEARRKIQIVFQDPLSSLNPRQRIGAILMRPLQIFHGMPREAARIRALKLLEDMSLPPEVFTKYPRQLSGGQQQRVAIARAFAAEPQLIICDEITSALDARIQLQILRLLKDLQRTTGTSLLFISHDLGVVREMADRVMVLQSGMIRESGTTESVFERPIDSYTKLLLGAAPGIRQHLAAASAHVS
ncbi:MAG: ABC transporter ATP-binding protein, partial [Proteobacteria bacterium]|nr:ABC transporter ATP-binding protein [Pseudomonadota bacterium]